MFLLLALVVGYLLGSLPFGYLVARAKGVNIFEVGSKNPGATNVGRVLGGKWGRLVFVLDALKGAAAAFAPWGYRLAARDSAPDLGREGYFYLAISGLIGALLGHSFSCFTKFRGGKGVATGAGGFAVLFPQGALIALVVWLLVVALSRYVSLASMLAAASLPVSAFFFHRQFVLVVVSAAVAGLVIARHRANIARLLAGTENKMGAKPATPKP
ncbi:MAG TPA: glycerol-3-phosphate 1-O-acyltransferase PlsY [Opitutaceae bacterium]|nr:glycerol-3-phosphate 1-O-acyltransferase PlsY [Opitutaceae bacterium]